MGRVIIGSNLNQRGDSGQFEADRSTWGFADASNVSFFRSSNFKTQGLYSCQCLNTDHSSPPYTIVGLAVARFLATVGKKYVAKVKAYVPSSQPIADSARVISIPNPQPTTTLVEQVNKTISEATDTWVDVEVYFEVTAIPPFDGGHFTFAVQLSGEPTTLAFPHGFIYLDQFEIYEYIDEEDPPSCTLAIDVDNTEVVNESSPSANDGSISIATTGGEGDLEYSKDGINWQSSNQFTGLDSGVYEISVREVESPECIDTHPFAVNAEDIDFDFSLAVTDETVLGANDGIITVTVTGTGGPFTFSIDDPDGYQSSNIFSGLSPGDYNVTVKNDAGDKLSKPATILAGVQVFDKAYFSRNPIPFEALAISGHEALTNYRLFCETRVEEVTGSGIFVSKLKQELPPDSEGKATFLLSPALRDSLQAIPHDLSSDIVRLTDRIKFYRNYIGHLQGDEFEPTTLPASDPGALTASNPFLVLMGGVSKFHFPTIKYLTTYLQSKKKFLTWAPIVKQVDKAQEDYLNFWIYSPLTTAIKLRLKAYFSDSTDQTVTAITKTGVQYGQLYRIPCGPANTTVMAIDAEKTLIKYDVSLLDQTDNVISEVRTFKIVPVRHPLTRFFMFENSLGAHEVHRFIGQSSTEEVYTRNVVMKHLSHDYQATEGELEVNHVERFRQFSLGTGYLSGSLAAKWNDYMRELVGTRRFFNVTNASYRIPMVILSDSFLSAEDRNYERFARITAREAYIDVNYTPDEV